ncbi:hypothetical protein [Mycobacterium sp. E2479]|uniref:hypothetical protein n=1 Tax=Mycobacterium sp. E2479 TaxID=1834134 RepID=UPI0007FD0D7C|nr:hypothetical protein [Mycobacterium sp. E2479]OBH55474.1 hypothetical protein A5686_06435 [Mycobacterium sp. E2479]
MPVPVSDGAGRQSGVYAWLLDREEAEHQDWQASIHSQLPGGYPRMRFLGALRAGRPVSVVVAQLPGWARPHGYPLPPKSRADMTDEHWRRGSEAVTIHTNDRMESGAGAGSDVLADYTDL